MKYIPPETVERARQVDLLTYLQQVEPDKLVSLGKGVFCTTEHDSLKISNGKWYWFSRGFGGHTALDYLIKVEGMNFQEAVLQIENRDIFVIQVPRQRPVMQKEKTLILPQSNDSNQRVYAYLQGRGIDSELIDFCIDSGRIYESYPHHNAVFLGTDCHGTPRYAALRGVNSSFKGEANGSDKRYSFCIPAEYSHRLHLFESAIDLLSYATLCKQKGCDWHKDHLLSLAGVYKPKAKQKEQALPLAVRQYLMEHGEIQTICLHLDNDRAGRESAEALVQGLSEKFEVVNQPPPQGKDCNEFLCMKLGLPISKRQVVGWERG